MLSVTKRVKMVSQPKGGYVPKSLVKVEHYIDNNQIKDVNVTLSSIQGLAVDYLTRFMLFGDKTKAFDIPIRGAKLIDDAYENNCESDNVMHLLKDVTGLDRKSVISTCRIVCYDS
ncbi:MAG: hypothetical protein IKT04_00685, partial [Clostridia bacterium]|nr:hypothetical protein [Clostridia bacterium]